MIIAELINMTASILFLVLSFWEWSRIKKRMSEIESHEKGGMVICRALLVKIHNEYIEQENYEEAIKTLQLIKSIDNGEYLKVEIK